MSPSVFQTRPEEISADSLESALDSRASERVPRKRTRQHARKLRVPRRRRVFRDVSSVVLFGRVGSFDFSSVSHVRTHTRIYVASNDPRVHTLARALDGCNVAWPVAGAPAYGAALLPSHQHSHRTTRARGSQPSNFATTQIGERNSRTNRVSNFLLLVTYVVRSYLFVVRSRFN